MAKLNVNTSIVDYLKSQGQDSSYSARKQLATNMGIKNYSGSEEQNIQLLNAVKKSDSAKVEKPKVNTPKADKPKVVNNDVVETKTTDDGKKNTLNGVDIDTQNRMDTPFVASQDVINADNKSNSALSGLEGLVSKEDIISSDVMSALGSQFTVPPAVTEADAWISSQLEKIQSGKTSYSDQVKDMMDKIMNREKFSYDVDNDQLFQQALASAMNSGKQAMQDTIGQASALTGGYGSTYATTAGNQVYNSFIEDAYNNLPQYYQMAMEAYQMEGDEMYRQFGMVSELDDKEYNRNIAAYDATYQHRNQMYNEAYTQFRDNKSDAFAMANLQLNEHGQRVSDAYNLYSATSDYADKIYEREYAQWADDVNLAYKYAEMLNSDYWNQSNQDFQASESEKQREWQSSENSIDRDWKTTESEKDRNWQSSEKAKDRSFTASENAKDRAVKSASGSSGIVYDYTAEDMEKASKSKAVLSFKSNVLTETEFKRRKNTATIDGKSARFDTYNEYIDTVLGNWNEDKKLTESETAYLVGYYFR